MNHPADISQFLPHAACWYWDWRLILTHAIADLAIAVAYLLITVVVFRIYITGRLSSNELAFPQLWVLGGLFVGLCGISHLIAFVEIWVGGYIYWLSGIEKIITATVSLIFVWLLWSSRDLLISFGQTMHIIDEVERKEAEER